MKAVKGERTHPLLLYDACISLILRDHQVSRLSGGSEMRRSGKKLSWDLNAQHEPSIVHSAAVRYQSFTGSFVSPRQRSVPVTIMLKRTFFSDHGECFVDMVLEMTFVVNWQYRKLE
ncbi:hypothetical protein CHARACLAT_005100 [Characodon lateralis]|uniref:Uncharacterized protein n=1 Tax=Characodon lateralis TaxID=208331 RepID=A0ABU7CLE1_9TELE|nr:hypothetical protein [Characodon lateralis]